MIKKTLLLIPLIFIAACQSSGVKNDQNEQGSSQVEATSAAQLAGPLKDFASKEYGWSASIPETWDGYNTTDDDENSYVLVANYDPESIKKKPDDYHEIKIEKLSAGEEESVTTITDQLLEDKNIDARKLLFTKEYQGTRIEFSDAKGAKGLMTIFRRDHEVWILIYSELTELDGQTKWVYQRIIETFKISE